MEFVRFMGWGVEVAPGSADFDVTWLDGSFRGELGNQVHRRRRKKTRWSFRSVPLPAMQAETLEGLLGGLGHVWSFESTTLFAFSSRGRAPLALGAIARSTTAPRFGSACAVVNGSVVWDLSKGIAPLLDRWTLMFWRDTSGAGTAWKHYVVRSDGAVWVDGVRDDTVSTSWITIFDGFLTITDTGNRYDDVVVLCFAADDEAIEAWHEWEIDEDGGFPDLPEMFVDGAFVDGEFVRVIGEVGSSDVVTYVDDGVWLNNPRTVGFSISARRFEPLPILVTAPTVYLSLDVEEGDPPRSMTSGSTGWTKTGGVVIGAEGQVEECATFDGSGYYSPPSSGTINVSVTSAFTFALWLRADAAVVEARAMLSKIASGVAGWLWFARPVVGGLEIVFRMQNSAGTQVREIAGGVIPLDEWHHAAVVHSPNAARFELYLDGERLESVTRTLTLATATTNTQIARLGHVNLPAAPTPPALWEIQLRDPGAPHVVDLEGDAPAGAVEGWLGDLDEFFAWSTMAATEAQVRHLYDAGAEKSRPIIPAQ